MSPPTPPRPLYSSRTAQSPLSILIIGGGVAGYAAAFALQKAGGDLFDITLLDRNAEGEGGVEKGGRQNIPPNAVKVFDDWGLGDVIRRGAFVMSGADLRHHDTEELVGRTPFHEDLIRDSGAPYLMVMHETLHKTLRSSLTPSPKLKVVHNATVISVSSSNGSVTLSDGRKFSAELIVGADGAYSTTRRCVWGESGRKGERREWMCSSMVVDGNLLAKDPELSPLLEAKHTTAWLGSGCVAWGVPIMDKSLFALELTYQSPSRPSPSQEDEADETLRLSRDHWTQEKISPSLRAKFSGFGTRFTKIMSFAEKAYTCTRLDIDPLESFNWPSQDEDDDADELDYLDEDGEGEEVVNGKGNGCDVVLIGDAAHPMVPNGVNTTGMALEDAYILSSLLSRLHPTKPTLSLRSLLSAFTSSRHERASQNVQAERHKVTFTTLPPSSPEAQARDEAFRRSTKVERFDGDEVKEAVSGLWTFDAREEGEEWWLFWRTPGERSHAASVSKASGPPDWCAGMSVSVRVESHSVQVA